MKVVFVFLCLIVFIANPLFAAKKPVSKKVLVTRHRVAGVKPAPAKSTTPKRVPAGKDAFLRYKVFTVKAFLEQLNNEPVVRARFAKHFGMPEAKLVKYFKENLVESYIPETGYYTTYGVTSSGLIYPAKASFKAGTRVFSMRNGDPILKWACGNPLSRFLPVVKEVQKRVPVTRVVEKTVEKTIEKPVEKPVPIQVPVESAPQPIYLPKNDQSTLPRSVAVASRRPSAAWLPLVALAGAPSGGTPEPASMAMLAAGIPVLYYYRKRRNK